MLDARSTAKTLLRDLGFFIHLPAILAGPVFVISIIYKEWVALQGFAIMAFFVFVWDNCCINLSKKAKNPFLPPIV